MPASDKQCLPDTDTVVRIALTCAGLDKLLIIAPPLALGGLYAIDVPTGFASFGLHSIGSASLVRKYWCGMHA